MISVKKPIQDVIQPLENRGLEAAVKAENAQDNSQWGKSSFTIVESTKTAEKPDEMACVEIHLPDPDPRPDPIPPDA